MMKNLTMTDSRNMEDTYDQYVVKSTVMVFVSIAIFNIVLTICYFLSLRTRSSFLNAFFSCYFITFILLFQQKILS